MTFLDGKQAWPWWLMLIIQILQAVVNFFTHSA